MPRPSTVVVVKATCALIVLILLGQILLFVLCRCRGLALVEEDTLPRIVERRSTEDCEERLKQLSNEVARLKGTLQVQNSVIEGLASRNKKLAREVSNFERAEKVNQAQYLSRIKSRITEAEFLKNEPVKSEYEVLPFDAVAPNAIYQPTLHLSGNPAERPYGNKGRDFHEAVNFAVSVLNNEFENNDMETSTLDLVDGIMRIDRLFGTQYDLYFRSMAVNVYRRIKILRPFGPLGLAGSIGTVDVSDQLINLIIPLSGRIGKFRTFMDNFVDVAIRWDQRVYLTIVFFGEQGRAEIESVLENISKAENFTTYKLIFTNETFSRGVGLQKGVLAWDRGNVLMFFCDVDIFFTAEFLDRCRMYSSPGIKVYYPMVFSLYNPNIVYGGTHPGRDKQFRISQETGFWRGFGFGMTCQYRNDFLNTGGFDLSIKGWGTEDVKLYRQHLASKIIVIRAVDRGVFHIWHHKYCNRSLPGSQFLACIKSKVRSEGSLSQLGLLAFGRDIFSEKDVDWLEKLQALAYRRSTPTKETSQVLEPPATASYIREKGGTQEEGRRVSEMQEKAHEVEQQDKLGHADENDKHEERGENYLDPNEQESEESTAQALQSQNENGGG